MKSRWHRARNLMPTAVSWTLSGTLVEVNYDIRRTFLARTGITGLFGAAFRPNTLARAAGTTRSGQCKACELAANEDYWSQIQRAFDVDRSRINSTTAVSLPRRAMYWIR